MDFLRRTWVEIDIRALKNNFSAISGAANKNIFVVVKADAYGHGAPPVAAALNQQGAFGFAVSNLLEAEELRASGLDKPILILGYTPPECAARLAQGDITQCIYDADYAALLDAQAEKAGVTVRGHLKLDTGMGRIGFDFRTEDFPGLRQVRQVLKLEHLNIEGIFTHFAAADSTSQEDKVFTRQQHRMYRSAVALLEQEHPFPVRHCCNSAATLLPRDDWDADRVGIILYGLAPSEEVKLPEGIRPVMSLYSVVSMVKTIEKDQTVSYGRTFTAPDRRRIATVCAGYADGVPRLLSGKGHVLINGHRAPIVGRICMDQFCVDVTDIPQVAIGDRVTIFGPGLPVEEVAKTAQTIHYEIICGIAKRVPRIYINDQPEE